MSLSRSALVFATFATMAAVSACDRGGDPMPDGGRLDVIFSNDITAIDVPGREGGNACPTGAPTEIVMGEITADTVWNCDRTYVLRGFVFVRSPAVLRVGAGTTIQGDAMSALIITRGARIDAVGTPDAPIVFTSSKAVGMRARGDWGGVLLLGNARINARGGINAVEGLPVAESRGVYGGTDDSANCGRLHFARIEFGGYPVSPENDFNGLLLGGCGTATDLDFVEVHMAGDDGIKFNGGTASMRHFVVTRPSADAIYWDEGWRGNLQFGFVQMDPAIGEDGFVGDNQLQNVDADPRSMPTISNVTLVGSTDPASDHTAMVLRRGTGARISNVIATGFTLGAVDVRDVATATLTTNGGLDVHHSIFFAIGANGTTYFPAETDDDDGGFDEAMFFTAAERANRTGVDPMFPAAFDLLNPGIIPAMGSPAATGAMAPTGPGFDRTADYIGAIAPGASRTWLDGWTAFPAN